MAPLFSAPPAKDTPTSRLARTTGAAVLPFCERLPGTRGFKVVKLTPNASTG
jgi:hypothetical protein